MATSHNCDFCSFQDCNLGVKQFVKVTKKYLKEILKEENEVGGKKKKQKIGHKLMSHYDRCLKHIFEFCEKDDLNKKFNNLALDNIRTNKDNAEDLGNAKCTTQNIFTFYNFSGKLFNMGSGNQIFDYAEASKFLLMRSYPQIFNGTQSGSETFLH